MIKKNDSKRQFGSKGEALACEYLVKKGYKLLDKNFRAGRMGEIDIIAQDGEYICFIEVKTRTGMTFGRPSESVNIKKQINIRRLAQIYIGNKNLHEKNIRFDVAEVIVCKKGENIEVKEINLIKNAF